MPYTLPLYNQGDPKWRNNPLGTSGNTIGSHGCTVSAIAMLLARFGITETPATVVTKLRAVGGFMPSGDLLWAAIPQVWPRVHFVWRQYTTLEDPSYAYRKTMASSIIQVHRLLSMGQPVLLNVDAVKDTRPDHWVVAEDGTLAEFVINNPDGGRRQLFSDRFGELARGIYGYTVLIGDTAYFPSWSTDLQDAHAVWKAAEVAAGRNIATYSKEILEDLIS
jgi:Peptidase_C39 like family